MGPLYRLCLSVLIEISISEILKSCVKFGKNVVEISFIIAWMAGHWNSAWR